MAPRLSSTRITLLRSAYLLVAGGLMVVKWPLLDHVDGMPLYEGVTLTMLVALSLLGLVGLVRPLRMLPVLLFEITWKVLWAGLVALPQAAAGRMDDATAEVLSSCAVVVLVVLAVPWSYVWSSYLRPSSRAAESHVAEVVPRLR